MENLIIEVKENIDDLRAPVIKQVPIVGEYTIRATSLGGVSEYGVNYDLCIIVDWAGYETFTMLANLDVPDTLPSHTTTSLVVQTINNESDIDYIRLIVYSGEGRVEDIKWLEKTLINQTKNITWLTGHDRRGILVEIIKLNILLGRL